MKCNRLLSLSPNGCGLELVTSEAKALPALTLQNVATLVNICS